MPPVSQPGKTTLTGKVEQKRTILEKNQPPLIFHVPEKPLTVTLHVENELMPDVSAEVSNPVILGRADVEDNYKPGLDLESVGGQTAGVSRRHAAIFVLDGLPHIRDMNSTNGTRINGLTLKPHQGYPLSTGDELEIGQFRVTVEIKSKFEH